MNYSRIIISDTTKLSYTEGDYKPIIIWQGEDEIHLTIYEAVLLVAKINNLLPHDKL